MLTRYSTNHTHDYKLQESNHLYMWTEKKKSEREHIDRSSGKSNQNISFSWNYNRGHINKQGRAHEDKDNQNTVVCEVIVREGTK